MFFLPNIFKGSFQQVFCKILKYVLFYYLCIYIYIYIQFWGFGKGGGHGMTEIKSVGWHTYHHLPK